MDTVILLVSFYRLTQTQARSTWAYRWASDGDGFGEVSRTKPLGCSYFPHEVTGFVPLSQSGLFPDMVRYQHDKGGHFPGLEQPEALLADIEDFVMKQKHIFA